MDVVRKCDVSLRKYPYPFKAMLAICSDLDETPDIETYLEISRFLNSEEETVIGRGLGLEVGNTMYFDMDDGQLSYWNTTEQGRRSIRALIRSGHIDCFHSYGDLADDRSKIKRSLDELEAHDCKMRTWIDHAVAPSNFGADIMRGSGDVSSSKVYHADLTIAHGVEYVWMGRVTSVFGQNVRKSYSGILSLRSPIATIRTLLKEVVKGLLSRLPNSRYRLHRCNQLMDECELRSGHRALQFIRCNPHPGGVSVGDRGDQFGDAVTPSALDRLAKRKGVSIVYTHLGKIAGCPTVFPSSTVDALKQLSRRVRSGEILVATTTRLLDYLRDWNDAQWVCHVSDGYLEIDVSSASTDLHGLTFDFRSDLPARIRVNGELRNDAVTSTSATGEPVAVSLPWKPLAYPSNDI